MGIFFNLFSWALRCGSTRRLFPVVPHRLFHPWVNEPEYARLVTGAISRDRGLPRTELPSFDGRAIDDDEQVPFQEVQLIETLIAAYDAAISDLPRIEKAYRANEEWRRYLEESWAQYREAIQNKDLGKLAFLLRNFFRNEGISGFWAHRNVFQTFAELRGPGALFSAEQIMRQYFAWKESCPDSDLREVEAPSIGNPWGYRISGIRVFQPAFEYHFQAEHFRRMFSRLQSPLVVEIGGGFGGLAYQVLRRVPGVKYLGFVFRVTLIPAHFIEIVSEFFTQGADAKACGAVKTG